MDCTGKGRWDRPMGNKTTLARLHVGRVIEDIIDDHGNVLSSRNFNIVTGDEYQHLLDVASYYAQGIGVQVQSLLPVNC